MKGVDGSTVLMRPRESLDDKLIANKRISSKKSVDGLE
jgi:hypothetical protein